MNLSNRDPDVLAIYRTMSVDDLWHLRAAFVADAALTDAIDAAAFCQRRIALIDLKLARRDKGGQDVG